MEQAAEHIAGAGFLESFVQRYPMPILETLLRDRSAGRNIIWADNEYEALGQGYMGDDEITTAKITGLASGVIKPRIAKAQERQSQRTKSRAEVFTPSWLCNQMNNDIDAVWFGRRDAFNTETVGDDGARGWTAVPEPVAFPKTKGHGWHAYVEATRLEITCGEAPFVCSRYDTVTGELLPVHERIGFLDRKLRVVSEKTKSRSTWTKWALTALQSCYGYEYQGDNLLIARINAFETYMEHLKARWNTPASTEELEQVALIISWNFWQMNGFTDAVPTNKMDAIVESPLGEQSALFEEAQPEQMQLSMFDMLDEPGAEITEEEPTQSAVALCVIYDWKNSKPFEFAALKGKAKLMGKKFYAVIGNPPYQEESRGDNNSDTPIYHHFYDSAYAIAEKVELISPARFLFNAGGTPTDWNNRMLADTHVKVLSYEPKSNQVFANTDIKGGVAVLYRDSCKKLGPIGTFTAFEELTAIVKKVQAFGEESLSSIITNRGLYRYSDLAYLEQPETMKKTADPRIAPSSFDRMPNLFTVKKPNDGHEYIEILGRQNGSRAYRWFRNDYVKKVSNLNRYKVIIPKANGSGSLGEVLSTPLIGKPLIGKPLIGFTETYISIGETNSANEAESILKYIKSKFARVMLGVLKVTQNNSKPTWKYVPLQDFTCDSDIDWSKSISEIDQQLYAKYGLDEDEIEFIETHVKEMS